MVDTNFLGEASKLCYRQIRMQGLLNDFEINRAKYLQQIDHQRVVLWMVVAITLAGVILAGIQLFISSKLADQMAGQSGELSLEQNKITLKSSVTGLFILVISFAFFCVFVYKIYTIQPPIESVPNEKLIGEIQPTNEESPTAETTDRAGRSSSGANKQESTRGMSGQSSENIKQAQEALKNKGHDPGPVDGVMGPKTQQALKGFQEQRGMQATGRMDDKTINELGLSMGKTGARPVEPVKPSL